MNTSLLLNQVSLITPSQLATLFGCEVNGAGRVKALNAVGSAIGDLLATQRDGGRVSRGKVHGGKFVASATARYTLSGVVNKPLQLNIVCGRYLAKLASDKRAAKLADSGVTGEQGYCDSVTVVPSPELRAWFVATFATVSPATVQQAPADVSTVNA